MKNPQDKIQYSDGQIQIGNKHYHSGENINIGIDALVRTSDMNKNKLDQHINKIITLCLGKVYARLTQQFARTKNGDFNYQKGRNKNATNYIDTTRGNNL